MLSPHCVELCFMPKQNSRILLVIESRTTCTYLTNNDRQSKKNLNIQRLHFLLTAEALLFS